MSINFWNSIRIVTRQIYNLFQEPVEQFLGFFPQVKKDIKGHILNNLTGRKKRQTTLAALCISGICKLKNVFKIMAPNEPIEEDSN